MTLMLLRCTLFATALLFALPAEAKSVTCAPSVQDRMWMQGALDAWFSTAHDRLRIYAGDPPDFVLFDATCVYQTGPEARGARLSDGPRFAGRRIGWKARPHGGSVSLPGGGEVPAQVTSFAAPYASNGRAFMVMALPSVWREGGVRSALGLETLMTSVFVHEMTHTRQFYAFAPQLAALTERYQLPDDITDDSLQEAFQDDPAFVAAWTLERDLLLQAHAEPDDVKAQALVRRAMEAAATRPSRFYTGDKAKWEAVENAFLTLEGVGQWAAYAWLTDPKGGGVDPVRALPLFRRGGRFWSQDEGLLIMLAVDRFVPRWREYAFDAQPEQIMRLWGRAAWNEQDPPD